MMRYTHVVEFRRAGGDRISQQTGDTVATSIKGYPNLSLEDRHNIGNATKIILTYS